jgi:hypothetical protein
MSKIIDFFNSPDWKELSRLQRESELAYQADCDSYWNGLSEDDKLKAFYSVVKRIHKAELIDGGSYRWTLYDVFGFGPEAYGIGMECGYMELHNRIMDKEEYDAYRASWRNKDESTQS